MFIKLHETSAVRVTEPVSNPPSTEDSVRALAQLMGVEIKFDGIWGHYVLRAPPGTAFTTNVLLADQFAPRTNGHVFASWEEALNVLARHVVRK